MKKVQYTVEQSIELAFAYKRAKTSYNEALAHKESINENFKDDPKYEYMIKSIEDYIKFCKGRLKDVEAELNKWFKYLTEERYDEWFNDLYSRIKDVS